MPSFTWDVDPIAFRLGSIEIATYSILFAGMFVGAFYLVRWQIRRGGGPPEDVEKIIFRSFFGVLIGGRIAHVLFYEFGLLLQDPLHLFAIWRGGLSSHGSTVGIIVVTAWVARQRGVPVLDGLDRVTFASALGATVVRIGNLFNSEIVGRVTDQSWGVRFPRYDEVAAPPLRHPSQLYEVALGLTVLAALWWADRRLGGEKRPRGFLISLFFALYFSGRFLVEFFKEYQTLAPDAVLNMGQWLSLPCALLGSYGLYWSLRQRRPAGWIKA